MPHYPRYTTTVIGAYSVPRWYEPLDRLVTMGQMLPEDMADAQHRVMQAAVVEQEMAGIDMITGGETHRRTHNRHSPPNAMLNYFWQKNTGVSGRDPTKADHEIRPECYAPGSYLPRANNGLCRSWVLSMSSRRFQLTHVNP